MSPAIIVANLLWAVVMVGRARLYWRDERDLLQAGAALGLSCLNLFTAFTLIERAAS